MAALTQDRNTVRMDGTLRRGTVAAATLIYAGAIAMLNADGDLVEGQAATGLVGVGRANARADNTTGAAGDLTLDYEVGTFRYANSAGADEITTAAIGQPCYAVDDQTVALTDGTGTRSPAGVIDGLDASGVWVRFDAALTTIAAA
ncbi:hypothetical protein J4E08_10055 [Sagittula sp. NFXS13]|uniref:hypothetical protein n=1 Tax=Sagittula sp. NFXS13 TaxID=2819095 RepID=UPI0032DF196F